MSLHLLFVGIVHDTIKMERYFQVQSSLDSFLISTRLHVIIENLYFYEHNYINRN